MFKTIADLFAMFSLAALTKTQVWETEQQMQLTEARNRLAALPAPSLKA